jgi:hypothetical protein
MQTCDPGARPVRGDAATIGQLMGGDQETAPPAAAGDEPGDAAPRPPRRRKAPAGKAAAPATRKGTGPRPARPAGVEPAVPASKAKALPKRAAVPKAEPVAAEAEPAAPAAAPERPVVARRAEAAPRGAGPRSRGWIVAGAALGGVIGLMVGLATSPAAGPTTQTPTTAHSPDAGGRYLVSGRPANLPGVPQMASGHCAQVGGDVTCSLTFTSSIADWQRRPRGGAFEVALIFDGKPTTYATLPPGSAQVAAIGPSGPAGATLSGTELTVTTSNLHARTWAATASTERTFTDPPALSEMGGSATRGSTLAVDQPTLVAGGRSLDPVRAIAGALAGALLGALALALLGPRSPAR